MSKFKEILFQISIGVFIAALIIVGIFLIDQFGFKRHEAKHKLIQECIQYETVSSMPPICFVVLSDTSLGSVNYAR